MPLEVPHVDSLDSIAGSVGWALVIPGIMPHPMVTSGFHSMMSCGHRNSSHYGMPCRPVLVHPGAFLLFAGDRFQLCVGTDEVRSESYLSKYLRSHEAELIVDRLLLVQAQLDRFDEEKQHRHDEIAA
jgi:hypothetical protein